VTTPTRGIIKNNFSGFLNGLIEFEKDRSRPVHTCIVINIKELRFINEKHRSLFVVFELYNRLSDIIENQFLESMENYGLCGGW
jgi:hypothetical protein